MLIDIYFEIFRNSDKLNDCENSRGSQRLSLSPQLTFPYYSGFLRIVYSPELRGFALSFIFAHAGCSLLFTRITGTKPIRI